MSQVAHTDDFVDCIAGNIRAASRLLTRIYDDELREAGLRITQVALLVQVRRAESAPVTYLAEQLGSDRSAVARDLKILERDGLVTVEPSHVDSRARAVRLTALGHKRLTEAGPGWRRAQARATNALGDVQLASLLDSLTNLIDGLPPTGR